MTTLRLRYGAIVGIPSLFGFRQPVSKSASCCAKYAASAGLMSDNFLLHSFRHPAAVFGFSQ